MVEPSRLDFSHLLTEVLPDTPTWEPPVILYVTLVFPFIMYVPTCNCFFICLLDPPVSLTSLGRPEGSIQVGLFTLDPQLLVHSRRLSSVSLPAYLPVVFQAYAYVMQILYAVQIRT